MKPEAGGGGSNFPTLEEVRAEIDRVDQQIIELFGQTGRTGAQPWKI